LQQLSEENNFIYLTIALILLLLVGAVVQQYPTDFRQFIIPIFTVITLAIGLIGFKSSTIWFRSSLGIIALLIIILFFSLLLKVAGMNYLHLGLLVGYFSWATWLALQQVLLTGRDVNGNKMIGAICIYLLIGLIWTLLYLAIAEAMPQAFHGLKQQAWFKNFADMTYFSYVTLTTLGYGDISPINPIARFLVFMEAIVGVFYMAILVASLVGARMSERH